MYFYIMIEPETFILKHHCDTAALSGRDALYLKDLIKVSKVVY